jgi:two-component system chemotaxis response regulator CheB
MPKRDLIVIGTSAGGVEALKALFSNFPLDCPASIFVVYPLSAHSPGRRQAGQSNPASRHGAGESQGGVVGQKHERYLVLDYYSVN